MNALNDGRMFDCANCVIDESIPVNYAKKNHVPVALLKMVTLLRGNNPHLTTLTRLVRRYGEIQDKAGQFQNSAGMKLAADWVYQMANESLAAPVKHIVSVTGHKYSTILFTDRNDHIVTLGLCPTRISLVMKFIDFLEELVVKNCADIENKMKKKRMQQLLANGSNGIVQGIDTIEPGEEWGDEDCDDLKDLGQ